MNSGNCSITNKTRVGDTGGDWNFSGIRSVNYFINTVTARIENGQITGNLTHIKHYLGEMYFFRAYLYFNKLVALGDFPIITEEVPEDYNKIRQLSRRRPRNEVARFILANLDKAFLFMLPILAMLEMPLTTLYLRIETLD